MCWQQQLSILSSISILCLAWSYVQYIPQLAKHDSRLRIQSQITLCHIHAAVRLATRHAHTQSVRFRLLEHDLPHSHSTHARLLRHQLTHGSERTNVARERQ